MSEETVKTAEEAKAAVAAAELAVADDAAATEAARAWVAAKRAAYFEAEVEKAKKVFLGQIRAKRERAVAAAKKADEDADKAAKKAEAAEAKKS